MDGTEPFARHGSEKMIYDIRMGPQGLYHDGAFYVAYQANPQSGKALPCVIKRDAGGVWSQPAVVGDVSHYDHHFAPVIWLDGEERLHVLYHCHARPDQAMHKIAAQPLSIEEWRAGPGVAPSVSYPRVVRVASGKLLLYYRALGHMGYWTYQLSDDHGCSWTCPDVPLVDFDQAPRTLGHEWAGTYHSVTPGRDGQSLHIAFVYWDERKPVHPVYGKRMGHRTRYNLYYLRLELSSGAVYNAAGTRLSRPVNRADAERCLVWDTGPLLTNMPSLLADEQDRPCFLLPVSGDAPDEGCFWFVRQEGAQWARRRVAELNDTWNGCRLAPASDGSLTAFLIARPPVFGELPYGGGVLQEWRSTDNGDSWAMEQEISPLKGLLCNNPKPVENAAGSPLPRTLLLYGWQDPDGIPPDGEFKGAAYLWQDGSWL